MEGTTRLLDLPGGDGASNQQGVLARRLHSHTGWPYAPPLLHTHMPFLSTRTRTLVASFAPGARRPVGGRADHHLTKARLSSSLPRHPPTFIPTRIQRSPCSHGKGLHLKMLKNLLGLGQDVAPQHEAAAAVVAQEGRASPQRWRL